MARTGKVQRSRAKLSAAQKAERRARLEALTTALDSAKSGYVQEAIHIAETHGR
jgi:predicted DNA-binding protein